MAVEYQKQPYSLWRHIHHVLTSPVDFSKRLCQNKSGLDAGAKLYVSYFAAFSTIPEKYKEVADFLQRFKPFISDDLLQFASGFNDVSNVLISLIKCSNVPSKVDEWRGIIAMKYTVWKTLNIFFNTIVLSCDITAFTRGLAKMPKLGNYFKIFKCAAFALGCIAEAIEKAKLINDYRDSNELAAYKARLRRINSPVALRAHYQAKIDGVNLARMNKVEKWQRKIAEINNQTLTVAQFHAAKASYWENKKTNQITNYKNELRCSLWKLASLVMDIAIIVLEEFADKIVGMMILGMPLSFAAKALPAFLVATNIILSTLNMHKFSFKTYFCK